MKIQTIILQLTVLLLTVLMTGCAFPDDPEDARAYWEARIDRTERELDRVSEQAATLQATLQDAADQLAAAPDDHPVTDRLRQAATTGAEQLAELVAIERRLSAEVVNARNRLATIPADADAGEIHAQMFGQTVTGVGSVLPPPLNTIAVGLGTLIGASGGLFGLVGRKRARKAEAGEAEANEVFESTVAAIENAKRVNMKLREAFDEASGEIRTNLSNKAEQRVNEVRTLYGKAA